MSPPLALKPSTDKRTWSIAEKRRIVELTMRKDVSVMSIAKQYHIHPPILSTWRTLYRNGKLGDIASKKESIPEFLPITIADSHPVLSASTNWIRAEIHLSCGASLCLESNVLDIQAIAMLFSTVRK